MAESDAGDRAALDALIAGPQVSAATRAVLQERLAPAVAPSLSLSPSPQVFSATEFATLVAVVARLLPPTEVQQPTDVAQEIYARLAKGDGKGWRYAALPPEGESHRRGLAALEASARPRGADGFAALDTVAQDALLAAVARADVDAATWQGIDPARWFEELMAEVAELHLSHPLVQWRLGYAGFADVGGWQRIGLDEREAREPAVIAARRRNDSFLSVPASEPALASPTQHRGELSPSSVIATSTAAARPPTPAAPSPTTRYPEREVVDAVVIGTGAGGGPLLARLAQAGLKVVALEAGRHWQPARDFATDERAQAKLFWRDERLSAGGTPLHFGNNNSGIGVGGSTLHYTAYTPRPQPDDFTLHRDFGVGVDWPLGYADLEPYFDEVETLLGVSGVSPYPWGPPRRQDYALSPLPLNAAAQLMQRACAKLGLRSAPAANAALSAPYHQPGIGWRAACSNRGFCQAGCSTGAKSSVDVVFVPPALQAGAELRTECFVTRIERDASGRTSAVIYTDAEGQERRQRCANVFLCAGGIETPRLLLMNELANGSGQVGRNFMAHPGLQLWAHFDAATRPFKGIPGGLISEDTHRPKDADFAGGYLLQSIGVMPVTYGSQLARSSRKLFGAAFGDAMQHYGHVAGINILGDCLPSPQNFLELGDERDARGLLKPRIHFTAGDNEQRMNRHADRTMRALWDAVDAKEPWAFERYAHVIGTCRMGADGDAAVVDADGQSFEVPGLYVCDNSVFPSALAVNPALTIMALSLRTADRFLSARNRPSA